MGDDIVLTWSQARTAIFLITGLLVLVHLLGHWMGRLEERGKWLESMIPKGPRRVFTHTISTAPQTEGE